MKKVKIILILLAISTLHLLAQDYTAILFTFDDTISPTQSTTYTARDEITLIDGFLGSSTSGSLILGLNDTLFSPTDTIIYVNPDTIENRAIDTTLDFGSLPGSFNVSSSGDANYSVPIYTPQGSKGTTPSLSVIYNSSMQDGLLGSAWTLSSTSTIHRMEKNYFEDSEVDGINLNTGDLLALDGNRMVSTSGTYGQSGSTYTTRFESFREIEAFGTTGNGPSYFKVTDNRGYIYEYGNTTDSKVKLGDKTTLLAWKLNKVTDPNGNYAIYEYDNALSGQAYLYRITYSGNTNAGLEPYNEIRISYQERSDEKYNYLLGEQTVDKYVVEKIEVKSFDNLLREYKFNYSTTNRRTFLSEIIVENSEGDQYNSTIIGWNDFADTIMIDSLSTFSMPYNGQFGDFNGDGYSDYITVNDQSTWYTTYLYINDGEGGFSSTADASDTELGEDYIDHFIGDFNGDGRSDVAIVTIDQCSWSVPPDAYTQEYYRIHFLSGPNLSYMYTDSTSAWCSGNKDWSVPFEYDRDSCSRFFVNDVNGDGISDFAVAYENGFIIYGNSNGSNFTRSNIDFPVGAYENFLADFTGDRVPDFATYEDDSVKVYEFDGSSLDHSFSQYILETEYPLYSGDFNGDGITDLYYRSYYNEWSTRFGTGTAFSSPNVVYNTQTGTDCFDIVMDFNGDGKDDIVGFLHDDDEFSVTYGWIITFRECLGNNSIVSTSFFEQDLDFNFTYTKFGDANGDGMPDLVTLNEDRYYMFNPNDKHTLADYIENGIGIRTQINYKTLTQMKSDGTYLQNGSFTFPQQSIIDATSIVRSFKTTSSLHDDATITHTQYSYTDAIVNKQGLGFLGFKNIETKTDSVHSSRLCNSFTTPDFYASRDTAYKYYNENLLSSVYTNKKYYERTWDGGNSYIIYSDSTNAFDNLNSNHTVIVSSLDTLGNLTSRKTTSEDGSYQETLYYNYQNDGSQFPLRIVKNTKHKDDSREFTSETKITYNSTNYQVNQVIDNYGKSNEITTDYNNYDDFGNPSSVTSEPDGLNDLITTINYDHTGRFVISKTTPLGQISYYYDTINISLLKAEDIYENEISYQYDNWGKQIKTISPLGLSRSVIIDWAGDTDPSGSLYYVHSVDTLGTYSKKFVDYKGRTIKTDNEGFDGFKYYTQTKFNQFNQVDSSSNVYSESGSPLWNTYAYQATDGRISNESYIGDFEVDYSYSSNQLEKTINNTREYTYEFDALGNVTSVEDPVGNTLSYRYNSIGSMDSIAGNGGSLTSKYNDAGIDTISTDPSLGTIQQTVNALGQPTWIEDGKGNEFDFTYDTLYRITRKENANNSSEYYSISYITSGNGIGQVSSKSYTDGSLTTTLTYSYDTNGRVRTESKQIGSKTYSLAYKYDDYGRLDSITDSNGKQFDYRYDDEGYMNKVYYETDLIWELTDLDLTKRWENLGSNITVKNSFNSYGQLDSISAGNLFSMDYSFSSTTGNLSWREQRIFNESGTCIDTLREDFSYDTLDRLTQIIGPLDTLTMSFDASIKERIDSKSDAGEEYEYSGSNNFQLMSIDSATIILTNRPDMSISYTSFNKVDTIVEGDYLINFDYGPNTERVKMEVTYDDTLRYTRYYFGNYELTEYPGEDDEEKTWFSSGSGLFGFNRVIDTEDQNFYIIKDHLGSVMTVANEDGDAVEFFSYDPWGRRRNDSTWAYDSTLTAEFTSRGYTGHEHMDETCLINMNGRVYDPLVGLFLSPDPMMQEPMNPLNYNRYSYVLNNPLKYTDPSGYKKVPRDYEDEAQYAEMQGIIDDWAYRNSNRGIPYEARGSGGSGSPHYSVGPSGGQLRFWAEHIRNNPLYGDYASAAGKWWWDGMPIDPTNWDSVKDIANGLLENKNPDEYAYFLASDGTFKINSFLFDGIWINISERRTKRQNAITLPGLGGIYIGTQFLSEPTYIKHEFGHVLQYREIGFLAYYFKVAPISLFSAVKYGYPEHFNTWTEWTANSLAYDFFNSPPEWNKLYYRSPNSNRSLTAPRRNTKVIDWANSFNQ